jgi:hypothetical protein
MDLIVVDGFVLCDPEFGHPIEVLLSEDDAKQRVADFKKEKGYELVIKPIGVQSPVQIILNLIGEENLEKFESRIFYDPVGKLVQGCIDLAGLDPFRETERLVAGKAKLTYIDGGNVVQVLLKDLTCLIPS